MEKLDKYWDDIHLRYISYYDGWLDKYIKLFDKEDSVIELGCGRAFGSRYLLDNGFKNIIACDFSEAVLEVINREVPDLKTMSFDMSLGLPFGDDSVNLIIADLSLHYFDSSTTNMIFEEIYRVLKKGGYLIARVNSTNDNKHIPDGGKEIERNFYFDGEIYKRFFDGEDLKLLLTKFEICNLEQKDMSRYDKPKVVWEFCARK